MRKTPNFWDKIRAEFLGCSAEEVLHVGRTTRLRKVREERKIAQLQAHCNHDWLKTTYSSRDGSTDSHDIGMLRYCPKCDKRERHYIGYV